MRLLLVRRNKVKDDAQRMGDGTVANNNEHAFEVSRTPLSSVIALIHPGLDGLGEPRLQIQLLMLEYYQRRGTCDREMVSWMAEGTGDICTSVYVCGEYLRALNQPVMHY
jgi:hypothetical protein